ncbi:MAG TPA: RagB/SusD family nutrient uptake outer membrane protein [Gemmatimonadaceae bacterium]|nr:RagB/SusD family nutrient uptake outer membrane protein [Gemmatimonadaceae bacterium]
MHTHTHMFRRAVPVLLAGALLAGCQDKSFLTENPQGIVAPTNFYHTEGDAQSALTAAYATFVDEHSPLSNSDYFGRNLFMLIEYPTEVTTSRLSAANERSMIGDFYFQFSSSHGYLQTVWEAAYFGINRANTVIDRVPSIDMDTVRRAQIVGQAKFLRAMHYYFLAGLFGGVPLKLHETQAINGKNLPRATAAETWAQIEKDLTDAAAVLPTSWPSGDFGRATKGAALTLLGKAYLQAASTGAGSAGDFQKAIDAFHQVQTLGYSLDPDYASLFDGTNEQSKEIIWSIQNVEVDGAGGYLDQWFAPNTSPSIYHAGSQNQFQAERPFYDSYNPNDIRKAGTWLTSFVNNGRTITWSWTSGIEKSSAYGSTGPVPRKYLDFNAPSNGAGGIDYPYLRYADVLLSLAEAIDNVSGPNAEAYALVNQVRARANVPPMTPGLSQQVFKDSLYVERRFELAMEGHGVFDMRRDWEFAKSRVEANMAQGKKLNVKPFTSSVEKYDASPIPDKWKLYPIPVTACELNPLLTQNPGWDDGVCKPSTGQ